MRLDANYASFAPHSLVVEAVKTPVGKFCEKINRTESSLK